MIRWPYHAILLTFAIAYFGISRSANAIVNVLPKNPFGQRTGFSGHVSGSFSWAAGSSPYMLASSDIQLSYISGKHEWMIAAASEYYSQKEDDYWDPFIARTMESLVYIYAINSNIFIESFIQHELDEFRSLKLRALAAVGPGLRLHPTEWVSITAGAPYMLEKEISEYSSTLIEDTLNHRIDLFMHVAIQASQSIYLGFTGYYQPLITNFADIRCLGDIWLLIEGNNWLSVSLSASAFYDTQPFAGVESTDLQFKTRLMASF